MTAYVEKIAIISCSAPSVQLMRLLALLLGALLVLNAAGVMVKKQPKPGPFGKPVQDPRNVLAVKHVRSAVLSLSLSFFFFALQ